MLIFSARLFVLNQWDRSWGNIPSNREACTALNSGTGGRSACPTAAETLHSPRACRPHPACRCRQASKERRAFRPLASWTRLRTATKQKQPLALKTRGCPFGTEQHPLSAPSSLNPSLLQLGTGSAGSEGKETQRAHWKRLQGAESEEQVLCGGTHSYF